MQVFAALSLVFVALLLPLRGDAYLSFDGPSDANVKQTVTLSGSAPGASVVDVWAWPASGPIFLGAVTPNQADAGRQLMTGWSLVASNLPVGTYPIVAYAYDPNAGAFTTQVGRSFTVSACAWSLVDYAFTGPTGLPVFFLINHCS